MTVADLIDALHALPRELPVLVCAEGGADAPRSVRIIEAAHRNGDWSHTPIGQYLEVSDELAPSDIEGEPFRAILIDLDP